jgi:uncharacterized membrane protein YjgN (DUF898 family)
MTDGEAVFNPASDSSFPPSIPVQSTQENTRLEAELMPLAGFVIKGTLLSIITLGIYRFWYKAALRRLYWRHTKLLGDGFSYTGTGKELLIGFLIALAIIVPLNFVLSILQVFLGEEVGLIASFLIGFIIFPLLIQIALFRARRYRLSRTRYRGVRFFQSGSGLAYCGITLKWEIITLLTLGVTFPFLRRALERYRIENTHFGSAQGRFDAPIKGLMGRWMLFYGVILLLVIVGALPGLLSPISIIEIGRGGAAGLIAVFAVLTLCIPIFWLNYRVAEFRIYAKGSRLGSFTFESDLSLWPVCRRAFAYLIVMGVFLALFGVIGAFLLRANIANPGYGLIPAILFAVGAVFLLPILTEVYLRRRLWQLYISSVTIMGLDSLDHVMQQAADGVDGAGEAFDTGFDVIG